MNIKIPKIVLGIPIIILAAIIIDIALDRTDAETLTSTHSMNSEFETNPRNNESEMLSNNLYSGPFAILDGTYGVDDTVLLIGSEIPLDSKGKIVFIRPDGKTHHKYPFDGSKSAVNHYFTPVSSSDLEECSKCEFFGTWIVSFESDSGPFYAPMSFNVIGEDFEN
ncbi:MAG: hypothetical protein ACW9XH_09125 [Candidatus Nitrosopumilus sp. bin_32a]